MRVAAGVTTIIPVGRLPDIDRAAARTAMLLTPVAILPILAIATAAGALATELGVPEVVAGAAAVGVMTYGSRAMHVDGLADTVDGLGGGWTRERALQIMRTGDVGPMGVAAIVLVLLVQSATLGALFGTPRGWLVAAAALCWSRVGTAITAERHFPAARSDGLGAVMSGSVPMALAGIAVIGYGAVLSAATWWWQSTSSAPGRPWLGSIAAAAATVSVLLLLQRVIRRIGGVTGDVFGAAIEVALTVTLVVLSAGVR
nr:adenosylcobinamide-GDP ribazoletransferase [Flexivirga meconopsidis]